MRWIPEIAAVAAAMLIALHTDMSWWQAGLLWLAMDLMTASGKQLRRQAEEASHGR